MQKNNPAYSAHYPTSGSDDPFAAAPASYQNSGYSVPNQSGYSTPVQPGFATSDQSAFATQPGYGYGFPQGGGAAPGAYDMGTGGGTMSKGYVRQGHNCRKHVIIICSLLIGATLFVVLAFVIAFAVV